MLSCSLGELSAEADLGLPPASATCEGLVLLVELLLARDPSAFPTSLCRAAPEPAFELGNRRRSAARRRSNAWSFSFFHRLEPALSASNAGTKCCLLSVAWPLRAPLSSFELSVDQPPSGIRRGRVKSCGGLCGQRNGRRHAATHVPAPSTVAALLSLGRLGHAVASPADGSIGTREGSCGLSASTRGNVG